MYEIFNLRRSTEVRLSMQRWRARVILEGPHPPRARREVARTIVHSISKAILLFEEDSHIVHKGGYARSRERDERRGVRVDLAPDLRTGEGRLGFAIRSRRLKLGWSQRELARRSRIDRSNLSLLERGRQVISPHIESRLATVLEKAERALGQQAHGTTGESDVSEPKNPPEPTKPHI